MIKWNKRFILDEFIETTELCWFSDITTTLCSKSAKIMCILTRKRYISNYSRAQMIWFEIETHCRIVLFKYCLCKNVICKKYFLRVWVGLQYQFKTNFYKRSFHFKCVYRDILAGTVRRYVHILTTEENAKKNANVKKDSVTLQRGVFLKMVKKNKITSSFWGGVGAQPLSSPFPNRYYW